VFNLDKLNFNNDPQTGGDGFFDFIQGITIDFSKWSYIQPRPFESVSKLSNTQYAAEIIMIPIVIMKIKRNMSSGTCIATHNQGLWDSDKNKFLLG
jgi:hypothetical protein